MQTCEHQQYEFVSCMNGEEVYVCKQCQDIQIQYVDTCSGG